MRAPLPHRTKAPTSLSQTSTRHDDETGQPREQTSISGGAILFIDAYDSFSNNITGLLRHELGVTTETIRIDDPRFVLNDDAFYAYIQRFDAVVAGPGPGHPEAPQDVGLMARLWALPDAKIVPALGICLGFQSLCAANGAQTQRLHEPRHGIVTAISHQSTGLFAGLQEVLTTQYHSLHMLLGDRVNGQERGCGPTVRCPQLQPLAWDLTSENNGPILMAVEHTQKPFSGVQFHPESICTSAEGRKIIQTWWRGAWSWNASHRANIDRPQKPDVQNVHKTILDSGWASVQHLKLDGLASLNAIDVAECLEPSQEYRPVILQSGTRAGRPLNQQTGRYSIVGFHDDASMHIRYSCKARMVSMWYGSWCTCSQSASVDEAFQFIEDFMLPRKLTKGPEESPFWGGLMGYTTYEAGLSSIEVPPTGAAECRPDLWFVLVGRSVVIDHVDGIVYVQSIWLEDDSWLQESANLLRQAGRHAPDRAETRSTSDAFVIGQPQEQQYVAKVAECQDLLRAGLSYELCLTDLTMVQTQEDSWSLHKRLSELNPAPFGAYMRLQEAGNHAVGITITGSSPERFLQWSRQGRCQFRPVKGTVSKAAGVGRVEAEAILRTQKETAENLMIVDLIRHDLAGVAGVRDVRVPSLMAVEEYETVFQLVSVIEGDLDGETTGTAVLAASLPPGSMTGAPKRRSCELLSAIEKHAPRGLYSGVLGYFDVGGGGDFSVVIRTAFKWNDDQVWRIGAGGAVTVLSTPQGEWDEMLVKRQRVLDVLLDRA